MWRWAFVALLPTVTAHTFHASIAQVDFISSKQTMEVIIWIHSEDIEGRMRQQLGRNASLDKSKDAERFLKEYLRGHFVLKDRAGKALGMQWVGVEARTHFVAVFFEVPAPNGIADVTLTNKILLAMLPDQVNTVKVKVDGKERNELVFDNRGALRMQRLLELQRRESYTEENASETPP
jgi:hypothetical protein